MDDKMDCSVNPPTALLLDLMAPPAQALIPRNDGLSGSSNVMGDRLPSDVNMNANAGTLASMASGTTGTMSFRDSGDRPRSGSMSTEQQPIPFEMPRDLSSLGERPDQSPLTGDAAGAQHSGREGAGDGEAPAKAVRQPTAAFHPALEVVFRHLPAPLLAAAACVSRDWRAAASKEALWLRHCVLLCPVLATPAAALRVAESSGFYHFFRHRFLPPARSLALSFSLADVTFFFDLSFMGCPVFSQAFRYEGGRVLIPFSLTTFADTTAVFPSTDSLDKDALRRALTVTWSALRRTDGKGACLVRSSPDRVSQAVLHLDRDTAAAHLQPLGLPALPQVPGQTAPAAPAAPAVAPAAAAPAAAAAQPAGGAAGAGAAGASPAGRGRGSAGHAAAVEQLKLEADVGPQGGQPRQSGGGGPHSGEPQAAARAASSPAERVRGAPEDSAEPCLDLSLGLSSAAAPSSRGREASASGAHTGGHASAPVEAAEGVGAEAISVPRQAAQQVSPPQQPAKMASDETMRSGSGGGGGGGGAGAEGGEHAGRGNAQPDAQPGAPTVAAPGAGTAAAAAAAAAAAGLGSGQRPRAVRMRRKVRGSRVPTVRRRRSRTDSEGGRSRGSGGGGSSSLAQQVLRPPVAEPVPAVREALGGAGAGSAGAGGSGLAGGASGSRGDGGGGAGGAASNVVSLPAFKMVFNTALGGLVGQVLYGMMKASFTLPLREKVVSIAAIQGCDPASFGAASSDLTAVNVLAKMGAMEVSLTALKDRLGGTVRVDVAGKEFLLVLSALQWG